MLKIINEERERDLLLRQPNRERFANKETDKTSCKRLSRSSFVLQNSGLMQSTMVSDRHGAQVGSAGVDHEIKSDTDLVLKHSFTSRGRVWPDLSYLKQCQRDEKQFLFNVTVLLHP